MTSMSILAATVWFTGIILHMETDSTTHAKIAYLADARAHHHDPKLDIDSADHTARGTWKTNPDGTYNISGMELEIKATTTTTASVTVDSSFTDEVRSLKDHLAANDDLWDELKVKKLKGAAASIEYTSGTLKVARCYRYDAVMLNGVKTCVARWVALDLDAAKTWTIVDKNDSSNVITLTANGKARIWNYSTQSGDHSVHYGKLLKNGTKPKSLVHTGECCVGGDGANSCTLDTSGAPCTPPASGATVECSNTQWP